MKRLIASLLCLVLMAAGMPCAMAEITDDDFDYWFGQMSWLVNEIGNRSIYSDGNEVAQDYLYAELERIGYVGEIWDAFDCEWGTPPQRNFAAIKPALNPDPKIVIVCAHFDSNGPGALDNASGAAAVLCLARKFAQMDSYADTELRFLLFNAEETGHQGSQAYVDLMLDDEMENTLAVFNIDILATRTHEEGMAFTCDTMGMRTPNGYVEGSIEHPAHNRVSRALLAAMRLTGGYPAEEEGDTWCLPRHQGQSDHDSFHFAGMDSANICFRKADAIEGLGWPAVMHTGDDIIMDFDLDRSRLALDTVFLAVDHLAREHGFGE